MHLFLYEGQFQHLCWGFEHPEDLFWGRVPCLLEMSCSVQTSCNAVNSFPSRPHTHFQAPADQRVCVKFHIKRLISVNFLWASLNRMLVKSYFFIVCFYISSSPFGCTRWGSPQPIPVHNFESGTGFIPGALPDTTLCDLSGLGAGTRSARTCANPAAGVSCLSPRPWKLWHHRDLNLQFQFIQVY